MHFHLQGGSSLSLLFWWGFWASLSIFFEGFMGFSFSLSKCVLGVPLIFYGFIPYIGFLASLSIFPTFFELSFLVLFRVWYCGQLFCLRFERLILSRVFDPLVLLLFSRARFSVKRNKWKTFLLFFPYFRFQVLYYAIQALRTSGYEAVYDAVEKPLQFAQTAAVLEVSVWCSFFVIEYCILNFQTV